ncbi:GIY-YIG nuclease family protein [Neobacillus dielmonensis]|uniref:GIY-YIG nuclease family protein n=1 Tax=Neobacillus dielmonensis TaxID=1347369 RepID=UPI0005AA386C|nr:GIY-YIG nuclease family protein [Neobacillus dielmonensis]
MLKEKVKHLPSTSGVYLMKDGFGNVIYVGKAKNLKRRVQSYFQNSSSHSKKIIKLKNNIDDIEVRLTDTEFEAFMLECEFIQSLKPFFNRKMKNPQGYTYITIQMDHQYPEITMTPEPSSDDHTLCFGPFINKNTVAKALIGLKEFCRILCTQPSKKDSTCLNYSLGLCIGMCAGDAAANQYRTIINNIIGLLNGTDQSLLNQMTNKMNEASAKLDFETARKYRDDLDAIHFLLNKEKVIGFTEENKNIAILEYLDDDHFKLFLIKRNKVLFSEKYSMIPHEYEKMLSSIKMNMHKYFKTIISQDSPNLSKPEIDAAQIIYSYLQSGNCRYTIIPATWLESENIELENAINQLIVGIPLPL